MMDPLSLVALGAAVGGAAGKFVEKAWDSGEKWVASYFANHRPKAIAQAQVNSADFLNELAARIKSLEDLGAVSKAQIESAQDHPDFSVALQKALLTAAQTDDHQKHQLLARTLAERLGAKTEGMRAMASKMALDAIGYMTPGQLMLLGLIADLLYVKPTSPLPAPAYQQWFDTRFSPYSDFSFINLDLLHLESLSCLKYTPIISRDLAAILTEKNSGVYEPAMLESTLGANIKTLWQQGLQAVDLSSVGQLVGVYVSDQLTGGIPPSPGGTDDLLPYGREGRRKSAALLTFTLGRRNPKWDITSPSVANPEHQRFRLRSSRQHARRKPDSGMTRVPRTCYTTVTASWRRLCHAKMGRFGRLTYIF